MHKIKIKPLSSNMAWQGIRYKTTAYKNFEEGLSFLLPKLEVPEGLLEVYYEFGISKAMDYDNCIKSFQDYLQKVYEFDDKNIYKAIIHKVPVKKGQEYILFDIKKYDN